MDNTGKVIVGVLAGIAAGAALGILFAPNKGSETRGRIAGSVKDMGRKIKDGTEEFIHDATARIKGQAREMAAKTGS